MNLPGFHFRMPRAVDPRRHHEVRKWADADREAARHSPGMRTGERVVYGAIGVTLAVVLIAALVRLL